MKNKRILTALTVFLIVIMLCACSSAKYKDGTYTAQMGDFAANGWKDYVELTIKGGKITSVNWDAKYKDDSIPVTKKLYSESGEYGMKAGGAQSEWHEQAKAAESFVVQNGIEALKVKPDSKTDAVSGCTMKVNDFDRLVRECLNQAKK